MKILEYLLGKTYDDDRTKCWLITSLTKINSNFSSLKLDFVDKIIEKYSRDKNVEIQQRCLEYSRLMKTDTSITKNQFTTTQDDVDIDVSLSFLNDFVQSSSKDTGKVYDRKKYEQEKLGIYDTQKEINYKPYQAPVTSIYKEGSKETAKYESRLYQNTNYNVNKNALSNELKVDVPKVWRPDEGYVGKKDEKPINTEINISSLSSSSTTNTTAVTGSKNPYSQVVGPKTTGNEGFIPTKLSEPKKKNEPYDPKKGEKEQLKNVLFAGLDSKKQSSTTSSLTTETKQTTTKSSNVDNRNKQVDLLGLSSNPSETKSVTPTNPPHKQPQTSAVNWADLDTVFSMGDNQKSTQNNQPTQSQNTGGNLLEFEMNLGTSAPAQSGKPSSFNNILNINKNVKKGLSKEDISPLKIETEQFGEFWNDCPNDQRQLSLNTKVINNPNKYFAVIEEKGNFCPIEIINNEAIAAGLIRNAKVLLHAEISSNGSISVLIKSFDGSLNDDITEFLKAILK
jgi:hypothetical protein